MKPLLLGNYDIGFRKDLTPFMIPDKAFPYLLNAFVYRGRVQKKAGYTLLGRLTRVITALALGNTTGGGALSVNLLTTFIGVAPNAQLKPGSISITIGAQVFTDPLANGVLTNGSGGTGTVNYVTGAITLQTNPVLATIAAAATFGYFPGLPVMGICTQEDVGAINQEATIFFDTVYAYRYTSSFFELPSTLSTIWTGTDSQQFWSTNFQVNATNAPLFWVTNGVPGLHAYAITTVTNAVAGPPSTARITTSTTNNFALGDTVVFVKPSGGITSGATIPVQSTITNIVNGTNFDIKNTGASAFTNAAGLTGLVIANRLIAQNITGQDGIRIYDNTTWANFNPSLNS